ncbi:hypothetical protein T05_12547 [Trichinella murrelli]|uniref:Uncharacterized protein n=1 Tax=Trichinella murrelli TaxID=144512 RepID=A0A0V0TBC9_9BILA|nr:hypothetical protein T05_12547 [Trichinella murrelli]
MEGSHKLRCLCHRYRLLPLPLCSGLASGKDRLFQRWRVLQGQGTVGTTANHSARASDDCNAERWTATKKDDNLTVLNQQANMVGSVEASH